MNILGISAYYHDSAAALVQNGRITAAAQEERFTRRKQDPGFPAQATAFCLRHGHLTLDALDAAVFYEKPLPKFERILETYLTFAPRGWTQFRKAIPVWLRQKLFQKDLLTGELRGLGQFDPARLLFSSHHRSHAASAFYPSPFEHAAILTLDGVGEWATTSIAAGRGNQITTLREIHFPHSLGLLYSAFTHYLGFRVNSGEYKLMGLAPYGEPAFAQQIRDHLISIHPDGSFRLNLDYFGFCTGLSMINRRFEQLFGGPARTPEEPLTQRHKDLAASVQSVLEDVILRLARTAASLTGEQNLCLAGGVALNCTANGRLLRDGCFREIWIQPAAGDAGGALGAALAAFHEHFGQPREVQSSGPLLGPEFSQKEIEATLNAHGARYTVLDDTALFRQTAEAIAQGEAVAWFQGRMEFGPRALGNRSILADPRSPHTQAMLNERVKFRESFRPFAPAVIAEEASAWFEINGPSPYMLFTMPVSSPTLPAVTHVDRSARVQTVTDMDNPRFHGLLKAFQGVTGCPVLVNTSFNVRGEPIVCTPTDALRCFIRSGCGLLVAGNCLLRKQDQSMLL